MKYFTISELCASNTANARSIDNTPPPTAKVCLTALITHVLDPVRELWKRPIMVNSGFRCPSLNKAVGGAPTSQHITGEAADITTGTKKGNKELFDIISRSDIPFDQLIDEKNFSWIHISYSNRNRRQILHL